MIIGKACTVSAGESLPYRLGPWRCRAFYPARQRTSGAGGCRRLRRFGRRRGTGLDSGAYAEN